MADIRIRLQSKKFLFLLGALFVAGVFTGVSLYWIGFWFLLSWMSGSLGWLIYSARKINLGLELCPAKTVRCSSSDLQIYISNPSLMPLPPGEIHVTGTQKNSFSGRLSVVHRQDTGEKEKLTDYSCLSLHAHSKITCQVQCPRRGHYQVGPLKACLFSPLGDLLVERSFADYKELIVQPRLLPFTGNLALKKFTQVKEGRNWHITPTPQESGELRPFVPGDPPRRIHWKLSAKQGEFYIRHTQNKGEPGLLICMELHRDCHGSSREQDLALEKALSLAGHLLARGLQVGVLTWDGKIRYLPPAPGKKQLFLIQKLFTELKSGFEGTLAEMVNNGKMLLQGSGLIWIAPHLNEEYKKSMNSMRKKAGFLQFLLTGEALEGQKARDVYDFSPLQLSCYGNDRVGIKEATIS